LSYTTPHLTIKGEIGELQFYFRKIPLHQQKFLVVSVFSNLPWLPRNLKKFQNKSTKRFSVGNTKVNILALTAGSKNKIRLSSHNFVKLHT